MNTFREWLVIAGLAIMVFGSAVTATVLIYILPMGLPR